MKSIEEAIQAVKDFDWVNATREEIEKVLPTFGMNDESLYESPKEFDPHMALYANDFLPPSEILDTYQNKFKGNDFMYLQYDSNYYTLFYDLGSHILKPKPQIDCVFIDGCHTYWCIKEDYQRALNLGAKYIIFHDIVSQSTPPCRVSWNDLKKKHRKTYEFTEQYDSVKGKYMGIGVIEITKDDDIFPFYKEFYPDLFD